MKKLLSVLLLFSACVPSKNNSRHIVSIASGRGDTLEIFTDHEAVIGRVHGWRDSTNGRWYYAFSADTTIKPPTNSAVAPRAFFVSFVFWRDDEIEPSYGNMCFSTSGHFPARKLLIKTIKESLPKNCRKQNPILLNLYEFPSVTDNCSFLKELTKSDTISKNFSICN